MFKQKIHKSKLMSRTVSTRIQNDLHQKLTDRCKQKGVTLNQYLKECIMISLGTKMSSAPTLKPETKPVSSETRDLIETMIDAVYQKQHYYFEK